MTGAWLELRFELDEQELPLAESILETLGCASIEVGAAEDTELFQEQPGETPLWQRLAVRALFDAELASGIDFDAALAAALGRDIGVSSDVFADADWVARFRNEVQALEIDGLLHLVPHGRPLPPAPAVGLWLEPGLAFGSGSHPTTRMCLEWLVEARLAETLPERLIDYGCGSGVLALAALALGASAVDGVDHDPQALTASRENAERNGFPDTALRLFLPVEHDRALADGDVPARAPLVIANILLAPLLELAPRFADMVEPGGRLLLSGLLESQLAELEQGVERWFDTTSVEVMEGWARVEARRRSTAA